MSGARGTEGFPVSDDKPGAGGAAEHPGPWRWEADALGLAMLVDAAGESVIEGGDGLYEMSPYVREIVRATPEMEALLREYAGSIGYVCQENCAHLHCR